jgi:hypothetical protein
VRPSLPPAPLLAAERHADRVPLRVEYDVVDEVLDEEDATAIGAVELFGVQRGADGSGIEARALIGYMDPDLVGEQLGVNIHRLGAVLMVPGDDGVGQSLSDRDPEIEPQSPGRPGAAAAMPEDEIHDLFNATNIARHPQIDFNCGAAGAGKAAAANAQAERGGWFH